jgi:hypothetical protein
MSRSTRFAPTGTVWRTSSSTRNVAAGDITPQEGSDLVRLVEGTARAIEVHELAERIDRLEAQMASKGNPTDPIQRPT